MPAFKRIEGLRTTRAGRNIFRDLQFGLAEPEHLKIRAKLIQLQKPITDAEYRHAPVAKVQGITPTQVRGLLEGRIDLLKMDTLSDMRACLGGGTRLVLKHFHQARNGG